MTATDSEEREFAAESVVVSQMLSVRHTNPERHRDAVSKVVMGCATLNYKSRNKQKQPQLQAMLATIVLQNAIHSHCIALAC